MRQIARLITRVLIAALATASLFSSSIAHAAPPPDYVWLEGEAAQANTPVNLAGWGRKEFLSGEKWLHLSIDADKVEATAPVDGALLRYSFAVKTAARYEIWNRIGFEFVRSPFEWRVDNGAWATITPEQLTTDLMELDTWCEVAWIKMGDQDLTAGDHTLEIRLPRTKDAQGKIQRILYASDALCLTAGAWAPNSHFKPDESGRTAADDAAAKNVFALPEGIGDGQRVSVDLKGQWEICRSDEQTPGEVAAPIKDFPEDPHWTAIAVPGDKNELRPDLLFAHRVWYRTRVDVPKSLSGQSFQLTFPQNNLNTTVFVNGVYCGFNKNPYARITFDLTPGMKVGVNEVWVGIRDAWYGYSANPKNPMKLRRQFNLPLSFAGNGFQDLAYPIWHAFQSGILNTPTLTTAGPAYAADVFCKPSVARKEMSVDVRLASHLPTGAHGEVVCEAVDPKTGLVEKAIGRAAFTSSAEQMLTVRGAWADPKLWWPDDPQMYRLRATVKIDGKTVDVSDTPFGFREWGAQGKDFTLNGVPWHGWADLQPGATSAEWLGNYQATRQTMMRYMGAAQGGTNWMGLAPPEALDFFDSHGVVVRRCGPLDGEAIGYNAIENDPDLQALNKSPIKMDLMRNWRDQMVAQIEGERNHPSILLWSIENEWLYINCINLYADKMPLFEAEVKTTSDAVRLADPTRLTMTDGGGANADQSIPIHGNHYVFDAGDKVSQYPALAYDANPTGGGRGRWTWDQKRPRFLGEDFYATGINPFDYGYFGGEDAFQGKAQARPAVALVYRMLTEGYRWAGYGAWHLWTGPSDGAVSQYNSQAPRAVFCRQWDWTFSAGQHIQRTFGIFNDTHSDKPIGFTWTLAFGGKTIATQTTMHHVAPGRCEKFEVALTMPSATARREGTWTLALFVDGSLVFKDAKAVSILPSGAVMARPIAASLATGGLAVYDPSGGVIAFLKSSKIPFTSIKSLAAIPEKTRVLIVGRNALTPAQSGSSALAAFASAGRTVIVLEQTNPLKYQGVPAQIETASNEGRTAFAEDLAHPALAGLRQKDFFTWGSDEVVYRNAYLKPASGGKSLIQCHNRLQNTALVEVPAGKGLMLLSQLTLEEKLTTSPAAQRLLLNLIGYGQRYKQEFRPVTATLTDAPQLGKALDAMGVEYAKANDPLAAITPPGARIAVISATPASLKALAANLAKVKAFNDAGGWIVFNGLTPEGLADYNKIVGVSHMIRPFRRERVTFSAPRSPLTAGLTTADIVMHSGERMFNWTSDEYVASDIFSYVLDYDDVAPFATFPNDFLANMVNGFVSADGWPYIVNVPTSADKPFEFNFHLPKPQEITEFGWTGNTFYYPAIRVSLTFDGHDPLTLTTEPTNAPQVFPLSPTRTGQDITLRIAAWNVVNTAPNVGVDNIYLKAKRSPEFYQKVKPMLNIGAMLEYKMGAGGIVLCNVLYKDTETVAENAAKKRALLAAVLRNLNAPFGGAKNVIAGAGLHYAPLDIAKQANQYRDERGWFGDKAFTFADLPTSKQTFGGVPFQIYSFPTSPVPTAVMLGGDGVPNSLPDAVRGVPVARKAEALFFLQAARIDQRRSADEVKNGKRYEMARYVVHYVDGQTASIPIYSEVDVDDYKQKTPTALPGAQIAWAKPYAGTEYSAVAYLMTWNNPRPGAEIASVDLEYGADRRGVIALLAVTAGE
jgi:hypothetical protein